MNTLYKHLNPEITVCSQSRLQRMRDRKALIKSIKSIKSLQCEIMTIIVFGSTLIMLSADLAINLINLK